MKKEVRLSQCMIVKNEEKNIRRALEWGKPIVMEQIVVDTGSTDRTAEIAEEMGAKVYQFPWTGDFSAAKNYAIGKASGNWIAFLDADEYFLPEDVEKLWQLLNHLERDLRPEKKPHIIRVRLANMDDQGKPFSFTVQDRVFQRIPPLRYRNRIHEYIGMPPSMPVRILEKEDLTIIHTGYTRQAITEMNKTERNIELLKLELEKKPDDYNVMVYLGEALLMENRIEEGMQYFRKVIQHKPGKNLTVQRYSVAIGHILRSMCMNCSPDQEEEVKRLCGLMEDAYPGYPDTTYYHGWWLLQNDREKEGERLLLETLERVESYQGVASSYASARLADIYHWLSRIYYKQQNREESMRLGILSLRLNRYNQNQLDILVALFYMSAGEEKETVAQGAWEVLSKLYDVNRQKDQLFLLRSVKTVPFQELARIILQNLPEQDTPKLS
ncbi:MAG TPA: glycosyltransferase family 2 protein [Candidatus Eisenbergiella merdipullorum]|uniref:Glycosyltransferase family 2 protein n=1 Tax=Candidatus Eisenbergiella merdipullorum TaxID=2838553 RepID=A0A9D2I6S3_9FIRM|nr:glycosyltransferase family 2 protein [Candidatus Eisenbergiella merdipullorum]